MNANEKYELFAERFYNKYHFLPLGKDDPQRPSAEYILGFLGQTFCELEKAELAATGQQQLKAEIAKVKTRLENWLNGDHTEYGCVDIIKKLEQLSAI